MQKHRRKVSFNIFKHIWSKINPKYVPTPPSVSGFHLNPSHNKTQMFTWPKTHQNGRSKRNLKMRKVWKTYTFNHRDVILWPVCQWRRHRQSHCSTPAGEEKCIGEKDVGSPFGLGYHLLGHMWIMLGTYVNIELANPLTKRTLLVIG